MNVTDLEDVLLAAQPDRERRALVEVGRSVSAGTTATAYFWSSGRISATVTAGGARFRRRRGTQGVHGANELALDLDEWRALARTCDRWVERRGDWAAFYDSSSGYPPGYGGACYYQPPGDAPRVRIGVSGPYHREGGTLVGHEDLVHVSPRDLGDGASVIAELWRRGERHGPDTGSQVGLRVALGARSFLDVRRPDARVWCVDGAGVYLEPGEEAFVAAVVALLDGSTPRRSS